MITKSNSVVVGVMLGLCALLIIGMSLWLGGDESAGVSKITEKEVNDKSLEEPLSAEELAAYSEKQTKEDRLQAPLNAEELAAYQVTMTNNNNPIAKFETNLGIFELELFEDTMPITAANFIKLSEEGFYDGVKFHRVIDGFMIQSGDPISKTEEYLRYGTGGPGYSIPDEHVAGEYLTNVRGTISMANSGPESGGSQFFINVADNTNLDFDKPPFSSKHPVFGRIISGMDVIDTIAGAETNPNDMPLTPIVIEKVTVVRS
jgi:peptidylprolyl isomerase